jgi:hypothetical protein
MCNKNSATSFARDEEKQQFKGTVRIKIISDKKEHSRKL